MVKLIYSINKGGVCMRDPYTVLSVISAIASLLSIIFDVPNKIPVSLKTFILILSIVCALFFGVTSIHSNNSVTDPDSSLSDSSGETMSNPSSDTVVDDDGDDSMDTSTDIPAEDLQIPPPDPPIKVNTLQVDPIINSTQKVNPIIQIFSEIPPIEIISITGEIYESNQIVDYEFVPQISGTHRFEFSDVPDGTDFRLEIYNSGWERVKSDYDLDNGDGLTATLSAGSTYYLRVQQYRNTGTYTLNIGPKKSIVDISSVTSLSDRIQYTDQENDYAFGVHISGTYRFEFSDVPNGTDLRLEIYNSGWEKVKSDYDLDNGDGLTVFLSEGSIYYLRVQQYRSIGTYTLNIGLKKDIVDISNVTAVSDSIQYTDQQNDYLFATDISGTYRFEFSDVPDGTDLRLEIYNSGWEKIKSDYDLDDGDGLTVSLNEGEIYYLRVQQYRNLGSYILNIGEKKPIVDISEVSTVYDSIQYTNQENDYFFSTEVDRTYRFEFSDVPDGTDLRLEIFNSGWERVESGYDLDNDDGLTVSLSSKKKYFIRVSYYRGYGSYSLHIRPHDN